MEKFKEIFKNEVYGWRKVEVFWLAFTTIAITALSIIMGDTAIGIIASTTGVICVVLTGKGKVSSYLFGTINLLFYIAIAWKAKYYGGVMLNAFYYFPMNIIGWIMWSKHMNKETQEVEKLKMKAKWQIGIGFVSVVAVFVYALILKNMGGSLPYVDSLGVVLAIIAQILCVKRYMEQWILWIVVDVVSVFMWIVAFMNGTGSMATLIMWVIYLLNAVFMFLKWYGESIKIKGGQSDV